MAKLRRALKRIVYSRFSHFLVRTIVAWGGALLASVTQAIERLSLNEFNRLGAAVDIKFPRVVTNPECMELGDNIFIGRDSVLCCIKLRTLSPGELQYSPKLVIGSGVCVTANLQVYCLSSVSIGDNVLMAANVFICDCFHGFKDPYSPYKDQDYWRISPIKIGAGSWIGQNVVIMPGVEIGEQVIIGANSVVTCSIPTRSIAVGSPARVIKTWNEARKSWESI